MPAASNAIKMSWIPRGEGKGGLFTNATYHDMVPDSTYSVLQCIVDHNKWRVRNNDVQYGATTGANFASSIDIFNRYSGVTQSLSSNVVAGFTVGASNPYVQNMTTAALIRGSATPIPLGTGGGRMCFQTVKNRLYMANGTDAPAISPDATASSCIPWGRSPQTTALAHQATSPGTGTNAYVLGGTQGTCNAAAGVNPTITWASGPNFQYFKVGQTIYINGLYYVVASLVDNTHITVTSAGIPGAPLAGTPFSYAPSGISTGNASGAPGSVTVTGTGGVQATGNVVGAVLTWATGVKFDTILVGSTIYLTTGGVTQTLTVNTITSATVLTLSAAPGNALYSLAYGTVAGGTTVAGLNTLTLWNGSGAGAPALNAASVTPGSPIYIATGAALTTTPTVKYAVASTSAAATGVMNPTYAESTGGAAVTRAAQVNFGNISFENKSYTYAVSYWNFTSGHITNPCTIHSVTDGAPSNSNVNITISSIVATNDTAYNYIILWRSAAGGSNLSPLVVLNNDTGNTAGGFITYTDVLGDDTALGTCIAPGQTTGPGKVVCPTNFRNTPPPVDLNYIAYWDGRFWGASQTQVGLLFFSARSINNNEDISCGVAEECWPLDFTRSIPEADGRVTGLRTVGNNLFVLTDNNIYAVVGNAQTNYGLSRVSAKGRGTSHFNTCVIPAEDVNSSDVLVHVGNDKRVYFLFGSGGDFDISYPINDQLASTVTAVGVQHTNVSSYLVISTNTRVFLYDLERKIWLKRTLLDNSGAYSFCEGLLGGAIVQLFGSANTAGTIYQAEQASGTQASWSVVTNQVSPGGTDRKDDKILQALAVYYPNRTDTINAFAYIDVPPLSTTTALVEVPNTGAYAAYFENPDARIFVPQTLARGRTFAFEADVVTPGGAFGSSQIYEISAVFSHAQAQDAVGASL